MERQARRSRLEVAGDVAAVAIVAEHRVAELGQVEADLVAAAGLEPHRQDGGGAAEHRLAPDDVGDRALVAQRPIDRRDVGGKVAGDHGQVLALDVVDREALSEHAVGLGGAREHQQAAGRQIEAMDQEHRAGAAPEQEVEQVAAIALGGRRGDQPGWLVDDDQVVVLVDEAVRRQLGVAAGPGRGAGADGAVEGAAEVGLDRLTGAQGAAGDLDPAAIDEDAAEVDQHARAPARQAGDVASQELIEAQAIVGIGHDEAHGMGHGGMMAVRITTVNAPPPPPRGGSRRRSGPAPPPAGSGQPRCG